MDTNPALAVRAVPPHLERWDKIGRLYRMPGFTLPDDYQSLPVLKELIRNGDLMPSITNVIGVRGMPHLITWAAKLSSQEALRMVNLPNSLAAMQNRPDDALKWLRDTSEREKNFWGNQGTRVHYVAEMEAKGQPWKDDLKLTDYEQQCIDGWHKWLDTFQPTFNYLELTGFGTTSSGLKSAGTADFHATIEGVNVLGDYKCVTNDTNILMEDGTQKRADALHPGDMVVAWDQEKETMVSSPIAAVHDNGKHDIIMIRSKNGQELKATTNHPILRGDSATGRYSWVKAEDLLVGDTVFLASGWNYSPERTFSEDWPFNKHLSPYLLGLLWSLAKFSPTGWTDSGKYEFPQTARAELFDELANFGFIRSKDDRLRIRTGLQRVAKKTRITIPELLELINSVEIPNIVLGASEMFQYGFVSGVQEAFANVNINKENFTAESSSITSLRSLQQFYLNMGQESHISYIPTTQRLILTLPFIKSDVIHSYGIESTKVTVVRKLEGQHDTMAIEVSGTHTHVTDGFITHNTNRSGLHADIALQLAANRRVDQVTPDGINLLPTPPVDMTVGVHISPKGTTMREIASGDAEYEQYEALRKVWDFHAFEGKLHKEEGVFGKNITSLEDMTT